MPSVPALRVRRIGSTGVRTDCDYVLYWMIANRRTSWNFSLQRAIEWCTQLQKPLVVMEALRSGHCWASDRLHRFILQGMADNRRALHDTPCRFYAYVEPGPQHGQGLLEALSNRACVVVTDDFPCFFLPTMIASAGQRLPVALEAVDSNGLLPLRAADRVFVRAYDFRRFLQKQLAPHLADFPLADPFHGVSLPTAPALPREIMERWPEASDSLLEATPARLADLPIDHDVTPAAFDGGTCAAAHTLETFLTDRLMRYADQRNDPEADAASGLSPWLHFGHISAHEVFARLARNEEWSAAELGSSAGGKREGWWGMSPEAESFLDELITWRELGYNMCWQRDDYHRYESLPDWAQQTLADHAGDPREYVYELEQFESARTHDELWNAAQRQLVTEGRMHNYLRMLWGKKILEWSASPQQAAEIMIQLNNKYAVDGRNPNSYSGIFWVLGRYDRAWGPERPIFGKIRYMSSDNTRRKLKVDGYIRKYGVSGRQE